MYLPASWFDLLLTGTYLGQVILNHFYYGTSESGLSFAGDLGDIATDFQEIVLPSICSIVHESVVFSQIDITEHNSGGRFQSRALTFDNVGERLGEAMPSFVAWSYKSIRQSVAVKSAHKRFGGVSESDQNANIPTAGALTVLNAAASAFGKEFNVANGGVTDLVPLAVTKVNTTVTPHVPRTPWLFEQTGDWIFQKLSSQVSRRA